MISVVSYRFILNFCGRLNGLGSRVVQFCSPSTLTIPYKVIKAGPHGVLIIYCLIEIKKNTQFKKRETIFFSLSLPSMFSPARSNSYTMPSRLILLILCSMLQFRPKDMASSQSAGVDYRPPTRRDFDTCKLKPEFKENFLDEHNRFRGMVKPSAADMEYLVRRNILQSFIMMFSVGCLLFIYSCACSSDLINTEINSDISLTKFDARFKIRTSARHKPD